jgi:hypothetical protein
MMSRLFSYLSVLLVIFACEKQEIKDPPLGNNPIFTATGSIASDQFQFTAGDNDCVMETNVTILNGIKNYFSRFHNGNDELKIVFKDGFLNVPFVDVLNSNIVFSNYPNNNQIILSKSDMPNNNMVQSIEWFVNGSFAGLNDVILNEAGVFDVCANVTFIDGSNASVCNQIILGYEYGSHFQVRHFLTNDGELKVWIDENEEDIDHINWYLDEQWIGSEDDLDIDIDQGAHTLKAELIFENGCKRLRSIWIDGSLQGKYIDDFASIENSWQETNQDYTAQIFLTLNSKQYVSIHNEQSQDFFNIESVSNYGLNTSGKPVVKIHGVISCEMQDIETAEILPFECEVDFALQVE